MSARLFALTLVLAAVPAAASAMTYNAISISPRTGAWGYAYDQPSPYAADRVAMYNCRTRSNSPGDCRIVMRTHGAYCGALALHHTDGDAVGWGTASAPTAGRARRQALEECNANQNDDDECEEVAIVTCSH
ncbi:MAG: DUF4189 domain-containing protein [Alphaproteobacteria bacterium]|nr:DUF4189 domain-containing protein [Alphaproteobacteria bacterium]MBV9903913.1 DUF4189 domain-containing protein [Alphaproteobacteria bacterium]